MTQAEFDKQDEQVIGMANREAKQEDGLPRRSAPRNDRPPKVVTPDMACEGWGAVPEECSCDNRSMAKKMRRHLLTGLRVVICAIIAALFLVTLTDPDFVVHLVNLGVLSCGITAAIIIDRHFRR